MSRRSSRWWVRGLVIASVLGAGCSQEQAQKIGEGGIGKAAGANELLQQAAQSLGRGLKQVKQGLDEAELTGKVYSRLIWDKQLQSAKVSIDSKPGGIVEVSGAVPSAKARDRALDLVANTMGVKEVVDRLQVSTGTAATQTAPANATATTTPSPTPLAAPSRTAVRDVGRVR